LVKKRTETGGELKEKKPEEKEGEVVRELIRERQLRLNA